MLLAIDAGNTNVVCAVFDEERMVGQWRISTDRKRTSDEYAVWLSHLMALADIPRARIAAAILASVVPSATPQLVRLCRDHFSREPWVVGDPKFPMPVEAEIDRPEDVGIDRLLNSLSAGRRYPLPLVVIDFGTATTFDIVNERGNYCGGVIAPGINLSLQALHVAAETLPRIDVKRPDRVIGQGTVGAMQSGVFWGYVGLVEGLIARITAEYGASMTIIATGGLAGVFAQAIDLIDHLDEDLTIRGLLTLFRDTKAAT